MTNYKAVIGKNTKEFRMRKGFRQSELAQKTGLSITYIAEIETSRKSPSLKVLVDIAKALSVAPYRLLMDSENEEPERWDNYLNELESDFIKLMREHKKRI